MTSYMRSNLYMWSDANDEKKSHLVLDTAYKSDVSLVQVHPGFGITLTAFAQSSESCARSLDYV